MSYNEAPIPHYKYKKNVISIKNNNYYKNQVERLVQILNGQRTITTNKWSTIIKSNSHVLITNFNKYIFLINRQD